MKMASQRMNCVATRPNPTSIELHTSDLPWLLLLLCFCEYEINGSFALLFYLTSSLFEYVAESFIGLPI